MKRTQSAAAAGAAALLLTFAGAVAAQDVKTTASGADAQFAAKAAQGSMTEVQLGQLAKDRGSSEAVKQFGQRMIDDHSKAGDKLKSVASQEGLTLPSTVGAKNQAVIDRLSKLSGPAFDRAYMQHMTMDHKKDIAEFRKEANGGKNSQLKQFASDTLPTLENHLQLARNTQQQIQSGSADRMKNSTKNPKSGYGK